MTTVLQYYPGQIATIFLPILDGYGEPEDPPYLPTITKIIMPNLTLACGKYPKCMTRFSRGLYFYQFQLPSGASAVGSYLAEVVYDTWVVDGYYYCHEGRYYYRGGYCGGHYHNGYYDGYCDGYHGYYDGYYYDGYHDGYCDGYYGYHDGYWCNNSGCGCDGYSDGYHYIYGKVHKYYQIVVNAPYGNYGVTAS